MRRLSSLGYVLAAALVSGCVSDASASFRYGVGGGGGGGPTTTAYSVTASDSATLGAADGDGFRTITDGQFDGFRLFDPLEGADSLVDDGTDTTISVGGTTPGSNPYLFNNTTAIAKGAWIEMPGKPEPGTRIEATVSSNLTNTNSRIGVGFVRLDYASATSTHGFGASCSYLSAGNNRCFATGMVKDAWTEATNVDVSGDVDIVAGIDSDGVLYATIDGTTYADDTKKRNVFAPGSTDYNGKFVVAFGVYQASTYTIRGLSVTSE